MSVELQRPENNNPWRPLRREEKNILTHLLINHKNFNLYKQEINSRNVRNMLDGGMGSIEFHSHCKKKFGGTLAEAQYFDVDDVMVIITIYHDKYGNLYEVDFWKVDFSPLIKYPTPEKIQPYIANCINDFIDVKNKIKK